MLLRGSAPRIECHNRQQRQVAHRGRQQRRSRLLVAAGSSVTQCQVARRGKQQQVARCGTAWHDGNAPRAVKGDTIHLSRGPGA